MCRCRTSHGTPSTHRHTTPPLNTATAATPARRPSRGAAHYRVVYSTRMPDLDALRRKGACSCMLAPSLIDTPSMGLCHQHQLPSRLRGGQGPRCVCLRPLAPACAVLRRSGMFGQSGMFGRSGNLDGLLPPGGHALVGCCMEACELRASEHGCGTGNQL